MRALIRKIGAEDKGQGMATNPPTSCIVEAPSAFQKRGL